MERFERSFLIDNTQIINISYDCEMYIFIMRIVKA